MQFRLSLVLLCLVCLLEGESYAQRSSKYGADFLAGGVGGRALAMGGTHVGIVRDVTAGFWNPAGLSGIDYPELAYMHAERFAGTVAYDYAAGALPLNARSTVALSLIRVGVDDIPNTLNAWDRERNQPLPNAGDLVTRFSYAHYAFFAGYARTLSERVQIGASAKVVRGIIGAFASSIGYSFDIGVQYRTGRLMLGANLQDATRMLQTWSINDEAFAGVDVNYEDFEIPQGGSEYVLPVLRLGSGMSVPLGPVHELTVGVDADLLFDGPRTYAYDVGSVSVYPRAGLEYSYRNTVALRAGIGNIGQQRDGSPDISPTLGAGLRLHQIDVDYAFGDFAGLSSDLGYSHRISLMWRISAERFRRPE